MAGINNIGQSGLSYIDQLKSLQDQKKTEETTRKQDLKQKTSYRYSPNNWLSKILLNRSVMTR